MRDASGKATGVLVDAAQELVNKVLPPQTEAEGARALDRALARSRGRPDQRARRGHRCIRGPPVPRLRRPRQAHRAHLRMIGGTEGDFDALSKNGPLKTYGNDMYALRAVKLYSDGALGSRGAALIKPRTATNRIRTACCSTRPPRWTR
jgi:predicted amidohydrolase YtcJ